VSALPAAPELRAPEDDWQARGRPPTPAERGELDPNSPVRLVELRLAWKAVPEAASYELVISRDAEGHDVLVRLSSTVASAHLSRPLPVGVYYWSVRGRNQTGAPGAASEVRRLRVTEDPPPLSVDRPVWK
jgi:hypothetical protein